MTPLLKRILAEKRPVILPLGMALLVNVFAYFIIVRPLGIKSAGAADRAAAAAEGLRAAGEDMAAAQALVTGKSSADAELSAFYQKVLPASQDAARRMTYASLPALAGRTNVRYEARTTDVEAGDRERDRRLGRMGIRMVLQGDYENLRQFLFELESAPDFVIIDDVTLIEGTGTDALTLTVNMSTYYRLGANGA
jgi:hypothetical protein